MRNILLYVVIAVCLFIASILKHGDLVNIHEINAAFSEGDAEFSFDYTQFSTFRSNSTRPAPLPYISGDFFRAISDHVIEDYSTFNGSRVHNGDIIFIKTDRLGVFATLKNSIRHKYFLITHNSDIEVPRNYEWLLNDTNLLAWFGQNIELEHPKLHPIPIGVANSRWAHGNISVLRRVSRKLTPFASRNTLLYININTKKDRKGRMSVKKYAEERFTGEKNVEIVINGQLAWEEYMKKLGDAKFVLSPPGHGIDCHRTWEALIMGAVPIVKNSSISSLYTNLPVIIVNEWDELNVESLHRFERSLNLAENAVPKRSKIWARYWLEKIFSLKQNATQVPCLHAC